MQCDHASCPAPEWQKKGATISDETAREEFGLTREQIVTAIRADKLHCQQASMQGDSWLRLLRREVEGLVKNTLGENHLKSQEARRNWRASTARGGG